MYNWFLWGPNMPIEPSWLSVPCSGRTCDKRREKNPEDMKIMRPAKGRGRFCICTTFMELQGIRLPLFFLIRSRTMLSCILITTNLSTWTQQRRLWRWKFQTSGQCTITDETNYYRAGFVAKIFFLYGVFMFISYMCDFSLTTPASFDSLETLTDMYICFLQQPLVWSVWCCVPQLLPNDYWIQASLPPVTRLFYWLSEAMSHRTGCIIQY